jgi:hypothetical protein
MLIQLGDSFLALLLINERTVAHLLLARRGSPFDPMMKIIYQSKDCLWRGLDHRRACDMDCVGSGHREHQNGRKQSADDVYSERVRPVRNHPG